MSETNKIYRQGAFSHENGCGQGIVTVDPKERNVQWLSSVVGSRNEIAKLQTLHTDSFGKSEGEDHASVAGCNANNGNAGRTLNANNAVVNSNNNYAGGFATIRKKLNGKHLTSRPSRSNTTENFVANGGQRQGDYRQSEKENFVDCVNDTDPTSLPFWDGESNATISIWDELIVANKKRNLKGLRKFYLNMEIATFAVQRTAEDKDTEEKKYYWEHPQEIAEKLIADIENGTYKVHGFEIRKVDKKHKTDKERDAKVYTLYDRAMQNLILTIIEVKIRNKVIRNNYSNIVGRSILCKDRRYCMMTRIRHASEIYMGKDKWILLTDIKKFYESVGWKVLLGTIFETIKDPTTRWLLVETFSAAGDMPIGCCLSPLFADLLLMDFDQKILRDFKPDFYAIFGDNRCFIGDKDLLHKILAYQKSYYEGRYNLHLKGDYQIRKVDDGFRFCKTWYKHGFVQVRSEMRRRAIRTAHDQQRFAGYKGLLMKTDSKHLLKLINSDLRKLKMEKNAKIRPFAGDPAKFDKWVGKKIAVTDFRKIENRKESGYYYDFQIVAKDENGSNHLYHAHNGSFEIKTVGDKWLEEKTPMPQYVTVGKEGNSIYFEEYHITNKQACDMIVAQMNINLD